MSSVPETVVSNVGGRTAQRDASGSDVLNGPINQKYEADLLGNIQQALAGLQGFDIMALELIQNADDAGAEVIRFDATRDGLSVWNSEQFTSCGLTSTLCPHLDVGTGSPCNFHAISRMGSRSKIHVGSQIGRFGIGFVSVYQVTDSPVIRSRDIEMRLDPYTSTSPTRRVIEVVGTEFELPWASKASATRKALNASPTPPDVRDMVAERILGVMRRGLFFLRHLARIELRVDGVLRHAVSISREAGMLTLQSEPDGSVEKWMVLEADAAARAAEMNMPGRFPMLNDLDRSTRVSVAIPVGSTPIAGLLFAYLPTEQPSRLPLHINADFFPHPNRRSIVLTGEQHDRYWNELLLETAADALRNNFASLRDNLGAKRLWEIGGAAFAAREADAFKVFWNRFSQAAQQTDSAWTVGGTWTQIGNTALPSEAMPADEQEALFDLGVELLHADLRPHWTALSTLGAKGLRFAAVLDHLAARFPLEGPVGEAGRPLWRAMDRIVDFVQKQPNVEGLLTRLRDIPFVLDADGKPAGLSALRHPPRGSSADLVHAHAPEIRFAHVDLAECAALDRMVKTFDFGQLVKTLVGRIGSEAEAKEVIGTADRKVRSLYDLITHTAAETIGDTAAETALAEVPFLRTRSGFTSPSRGLLPGGFNDPIGHLEVVDIDLMSQAMLDFARTRLGVETLSFADYVRKHLPAILAGRYGQAEYRDLMREIALHWRELEAGGGLAALAKTRFIRNRAGTLSQPADVYFFTAQLELSLGAQPERWVDENWLPADASHARLRDLLEGELGLPRRPAVAHLVDRIEGMSDDSLTDDVVKSLNQIVRHLIERLPTMRDAERSELERLRYIDWLPASLNGSRIADTWHAPHEVFRPFRASGFSSQAAVVDLPVFRSTQVRGLTDLLEFLEMPEEPATAVVVSHLMHCMEAKVAASDITYQILSERVERDPAALEPLRGTAFIYVGATKQWLSADEVFWEAPPFRGHWHAASQNMHLRAPLYRMLDVVDRPEPRHHVAMLRRLAQQDALNERDLGIHERCLAVLAEALEAGAYDDEDLLDATAGEPVLINLDGETIFPEDAIWLDAEWLESPFCGALDDRLVGRPQCSRGAAARLFAALGVTPLSAVARLVLAAEPDGRLSGEAGARLAERAELLLWLPQTSAARSRLRDVLTALEVRLTDVLTVQAEIVTSDPPTRSPAAPQAAFYDAATGMLHMREQDGSPLDWSAAFRDIFAQLDLVPPGEDVRPVIMAAVYVVGANSFAEAAQALRTADYHAPDFTETVFDHGDAFEDQEDEVVQDAGEADAPSDADRDDDAVDGAPSDEDHDQDTVVGTVRTSSAGMQPPPRDQTTSGGAAREDGSGGGSPAQAGLRPNLQNATTGTGVTGGWSGIGGSGTPSPSPDRPGSDAAGRGAGPAVPRQNGSAQGQEPQGDAERQSRRSRLLAYVASKAASTTQGSLDDRSREEAALIDVAAIDAVLRYELAAGRTPVEQSHTNPGFDVRSAFENGSAARLIEVKGLAAGWNERGVKLSSVQFEMAQDHPEQFWIYVVENARDLEKQKVHAIANPFSKVVEYWFDHGWRGVAEESGGGRTLNLVPGARLRHRVWGVGRVLKVERNGSTDFITIEFAVDGRKYIPFNSMLSFVD